MQRLIRISDRPQRMTAAEWTQRILSQAIRLQQDSNTEIWGVQADQGLVEVGKGAIGVKPRQAPLINFQWIAKLISLGWSMVTLRILRIP